MNPSVRSEPVGAVLGPGSARAVPDGWRRAGFALAGPALIVGSVAVLMRGFLLGRLTAQHPDILAYWLPTYCTLGKSLAAGHVPAWNPFVMGGVPFAADPQSGWMYAPAMLLFGALPCATAMGLMIALQPALAGLGLYAFARSEGLSRPAATVAGLGIAVPLAGSRLGLFLPFPASLAWTALLLAAASRCVRAHRFTARVLWAGLAGAAWGQLLGAHAGHGLLIGTAALVAYLLAVSFSMVGGGQRRTRDALAVVGLIVGATVVLSPAVLLPRLAYLGRSSYSTGYAGLAQLNGRTPDWPLLLATAPGLYLGAVPLVLSLAAGRVRRHRATVAAFAAFGFVTYVLSLAAVAHPLARRLDSVPVLDFYQHYPGRLALGLLLAIPILGAVGLDGLLSVPSTTQRLARAAPGVLVWLGLPLLVGIAARDLWLLAGGVLAGAACLTALGRRPPWVAASIPVVLAVELLLGGLLGQSGDRSSAVAARPGDAVWFDPLRRPSIEGSAYLREGAVVDALMAGDGGRYLSLAPDLVSRRGYLTHQDPRSWGLLANQRSMLFGIEDAQGYNPFQVERYWTFVRLSAGGELLDYNAAVFPDPPPAALDLLQVGWVVGPAGGAPIAGGTPAATDGRWTLYRLHHAPPRAEVVGAWRIVPDRLQAMTEVLSPGFDPSARILLEHETGIGAATGPTPSGTATYRWEGRQAATIEVVADGPALVLVRNVYDPNWQATVDGRPAPLLAADGLVQAVPVPSGRHTVRLRYDDPWIGRGLIGSAIGLALLAGGLLAMRIRTRPSGAAPGPAPAGPPLNPGS